MGPLFLLGCLVGHSARPLPPSLPCCEGGEEDKEGRGRGGAEGGDARETDDAGKLARKNVICWCWNEVGLEVKEGGRGRGQRGEKRRRE